MIRTLGLTLGVLLAANVARADDAKKYELKIEPGTAKVGAKGKAAVKINVAAGSHVSEDAPMKFVLKAEGVKLDKEKLTQADVIEGKGASPKLEIPFTAEKAGAAKIEADATFIVCTKELCEREQEHLSIPVNVQ
ncbi:MAG: hypothetical protein JST54_04070 [Deltaproteobacteria bacterium]|nr:hypothetical protein [Deltaproteobacteria bacterium]